MLKAVLSVLTALSLSPAAAEPLAVDGMQGLGDTRQHVFTSEFLGRDYHVLVGLPDSYRENEDRSYPVVFILDGGLLFPMLQPYTGYLRAGGEIPELILVGISYGTDDWREGNNRSHDFTANADDQLDWGGAGDFQEFLATELIPFVEKNYRSRPDRRIVFGQSLGAQFVLYTAQTKPDLFWGHIASNPALHRNLEFFIQPRDVEPSTTSRLYVASASNDAPAFRASALRWMDYWIGRPDKPWELRFETLKGHNHFSAPPVSFRNGLIWLFGY
jgi:predicted alpha/beta superfamily hydrolase